MCKDSVDLGGEAGVNSLQPQQNDCILQSRTHLLVLLENFFVPKEDCLSPLTKAVLEGAMELHVEVFRGIRGVVADVVDGEEVGTPLLDLVVLFQIGNNPREGGGELVNVVCQGVRTKDHDECDELGELGIAGG